ncbi:MAG: prolyl oligopeptidase family serine peptidase, partial [Chloroflexota bacterium]
VGALGWSPNGSRLCAVATDLPGGHVGPLVYQGRVYALEEGGEPIPMSDTSFAPATVAAPQHRGITMYWSADGDIHFLASRAGRSHLCSVPDIGGKTRVLADEPAVCSSLSASGDGPVFAMLGSGPSDPGNIWTWQTSEGRLTRVTGCNDGYLAERPPARLEKGSVTRDGMDIEYRVLFPPDAGVGSGPLPLVLDIHGGPNGAFYDSFVPWQQILASHGYAVLAVNPRGSSTYGADFMMSVLGDWGGEDYLDLMHVLDRVSVWPEIDESRMGVHGYSYGGYMTCWAIGHTNRFRAAVAGAPCTDLVSMYGTSDIGVSFGEKHWGGARRENIDRALDRSPITHAGAIETPLLLMHGEADVRVPIGQSEEMYVSLKRARKPVKFVRFPDCSHLFLRGGRPSLREEYHRRLLDWFDRHLAG